MPRKCHLSGIPILFFGLRFPEISRFNHSTAFRAIPSNQKSENPEVNHSTAICAAYLFFFSAFDFQKFLDSTIQQHFALYLRIRNQKSQKSTIQLPFARHTYSFFRPSISRNFSIQPFNSISRYTFESEIRKPRSQPFNCHLRGIPILLFGLRFPEISRFNHSTAFRAIPSNQKSEIPEVNHSTAICAAYLFFFSAFDFQKFLNSTIQQHFALYLRIS